MEKAGFVKILERVHDGVQILKIPDFLGDSEFSEFFVFIFLNTFCSYSILKIDAASSTSLRR